MEERFTLGEQLVKYPSGLLMNQLHFWEKKIMYYDDKNTIKD